MQHHITTRKLNILSTLIVCGLILMGAAFQYGGIKHDLISTVSSSSSLVLTNTSTQVQRITGSTAQAIVLPDAQTSRVGWWFEVSNDSSATTTVQNFNNYPIGTIAAGNSAKFYLTSTATTGGPWDLLPGNGSSGGGGGGGNTMWFGQFGTDCTWTNTQSYPGPLSEFAADGSCTLTEIINNGMGTVTAYGSSKPGVTFTAPSTGYVRTCIQSTIIPSSSGAYYLVAIFDGTTTQTQELGNSATTEIPYHQCVVTSVTATTSYTIQALGAISVGTLTLNGGGYVQTAVIIDYL